MKKESYRALLLFFLGGCAVHSKLPDYVPMDTLVLHKVAQQFTFPLTKDDLKDIDMLEAKYDAEKNCAGLAGPQIGIGKSVIIFSVSDDPDLKKFRKDLLQTMPKTVWLNPTYNPVGRKMTEDWEGCFSVPDVAGSVKRYNKIRYTAFDRTGKEIKGEASGFLARAIQHEIDHVHGILFTEKAIKTMPLEEYRAMRKKVMEIE